MQFRNQKGFTLIEIAIVLTIVGLVIGGIWLAASTVLNNNKKTETARQVVQIVQNVKNLFANQTGATPATGFTTPVAVQAGVFPPGMVSGTAAAPVIRHAFSTGTTSNVTLAAAASGNAVILTVGVAGDGLPRDACVELLSRVVTNGNFGKYGITSVTSNGTTVAESSSIATINSACANATDDNIVAINVNVP